MLLAVLALFACDSTPESYEPEPNVFCLLRTDQPRTIAMAGMTVAYGDSIGPGWNGVSGVDVTVRHSGTDYGFEELPDSVGFYFTDSLPLVPGDSYWLTMRYPDGKMVRGATKMQPAGRIDSVLIDTTLTGYEYPYDTIFRFEYYWTEDSLATQYMSTAKAYYRSGSRGSGWCNGPHDADGGRDSLIGVTPVLIDHWGGLVPETLRLERVTLGVWVVDRNYRDYSRVSWWDNTDPEQSMHLEGGLGVFGSACIAETTLYFTPPR
jgi:hypothetical protein